MNRPVKAADVRRNLAAKGFRSANKTGRDHEWFVFYEGEQATDFRVKLSHGASEIRQDEIRVNAKGLQIRADDLFKILSCVHDFERTREIAVGSNDLRHPNVHVRLGRRGGRMVRS
jgi:hypothetical protein